jgi:hypothetical protein
MGFEHPLSLGRKFFELYRRPDGPAQQFAAAIGTMTRKVMLRTSAAKRAFE